MNKPNLFVVTVAIAALLLSGCVQPNENGATANGPNPNSPDDTATGNVKEFVIEAFEYSYSTLDITVNQGDTVRVTLKNRGTKLHNFVIDELNARTQALTPGEEEAIEFTASQKGSFAFYCSVPGHRALGMEGQIKVE